MTYVGHDGSSPVSWTRYRGVEPVEPIFNATRALLDRGLVGTTVPRTNFFLPAPTPVAAIAIL